MKHSSKRKGTFSIWALFMLPILSIGPVSAAEEELTENANWPNGSWQLEYEYDDFSEKIHHAKLTYAPQDFASQKAFLIRCQPFYTNFSTSFLEEKNNLMENGKLHNDSSKYAKHGFIYDQKQDLKVEVAGRSFSEEVSVGGQIRALSNWFPLADSFKAANKDKVSVSWHTSMVFKEIPSFTSTKNTDLSRKLFKAFKAAIENSTPMHFQLDMPNGIQQKYSLDVQRLKKFAPPEVLDFCLLNRTLRDD